MTPAARSAQRRPLATRGDGRPAGRAQRHCCELEMSLFGPSPPSLPSAPSETISYGALCAGRRVLVLVAPRILRHRRLLPVRPVPVGDAGGRRDQRLQAFLRRRIAADLELVEVERLGDLADLDLRGVGLRLLALADEVAAHDSEHDADQHQDDEDFDQRHAASRAEAPKGAARSHAEAGRTTHFDATQDESWGSLGLYGTGLPARGRTPRKI